MGREHWGALNAELLWTVEKRNELYNQPKGEAMTAKTKPLSQINEEAIQILTRELGTADTARFIQQFTTGEGDYTKERRERLKDTSIDDVMREIKKRRKRRNI